MPRGWDLFVDEQKDGGTIRSIGALCLHAGVQAVFHDQLVKAKNKITSKERVNSEIHWTALDAVAAKVAKKWLDLFFGGPLMFFVRIDVANRSQVKMETLVKTLIEFLEQTPSVPSTFDRAETTVHVDYDNAFEGSMLSKLWHDFGLLRVFRWDSHGSELLQLSDILLGISDAEIKGNSVISEGRSIKAKIKADVAQHARARALRAASNGKSNAVVVLRGESECRLY